MSIGLYKRRMVSCLAQPQTFIAKMTTSKSKKPQALAAQSSPMSRAFSNNANIANSTVARGASSSAKKSKSSMSTSAHKMKRELIKENNQPGMTLVK